MSKRQATQETADAAQQRVNKLSTQSSDLHQQVTRLETELQTTRELVAEGDNRGTEQVVRLTQRLAGLRQQLSDVEKNLLEAAQSRDAALAREQLDAARKDAEKAPELRELVDQRARAAERVQAAVQEFAAAVEEADQIAWSIRKKGGQAITGEAVTRMLAPRFLAGALWTVRASGEPLGRRLGAEKPHKPVSFTQADEGFRSRLLTAVARVEARPAELEAAVSGKKAA